MLYPYGITLLILCPLIFLAAFIDSVAGGGGLISLPAYIFAGIPVHAAGGTNKFSGSAGTLVASVNYIRGGCVDFPAAVSGSLFAFLGAWVGTRLALSLSPGVLRICLMAVLPPVGVFVFSRRGGEMRRTGKPLPAGLKLALSSLIGLATGCYDGFFGPGAGMFMTLAFSAVVRLELAKAAGTSKIVNLSSNLVSMAAWLINGKILFPVAVPCAVFSAAGSFLGSRMAMKSGGRIIRPVLAAVAALLFAKILLDLVLGR
ncbi:MAG: TSUP family transporter [Treponema sp.]|nr:TSUP family transporter [Treponema sp.]